MKRTICFIMSVIMLTLPSLSGCGDKSVQEPAKDNVAATVGDFEITTEDLGFYIKVSEIISKVQSEVGSGEGWENLKMSDGRTAREYVIETALDTAHTIFAYKAKAREMGVYDSAAEEAFVEEQIASSGGIENLKASGYDESALRSYFAGMGALYAMAKASFTEEEAKAAFESDYITAKHILFTFEGDGTGDDDANTLKKAQDAYKRAKSGERFEDLITELNQDPGEDPEAGYTFAEGEMVDEFYQASKALGIGEISEPVRTDFGYHVIKRCPLPEKGTETYDAYIENIRVNKGCEALYEDMENWEDTYKLVRNEDVIESIDISEFETRDNYVDASVFDETEAE